MTRFAALLAWLALLVGLVGSVACYLTYRPSGTREWTAAAADFGALAFASPWVWAVAATAVAATALALLLGRERPEDREYLEYAIPPPMAAGRLRLAKRLGVAAGLSWLVLALAVFRVPLEVTLGPLARAAGLDWLAPPAPGFVLRVTSDPPGGRLSVNGIDRGTAPMIVNVICKKGRPVRLRIVKDDFRPWEHEVECRDGKAVLVEAELSR